MDGESDKSLCYHVAEAALFTCWVSLVQSRRRASKMNGYLWNTYNVWVSGAQGSTWVSFQPLGVQGTYSLCSDTLLA